MSIIYNNNKISKIYFGDSEITKIYRDNMLVYVNMVPEVTDYDLLCTYNVTSTTSPTQLSNDTALTTNIDEMYIDDRRVAIGNACNFDTIGEHTVKYKLIDNTNIGDYAFYNCRSLTSIDIPNSVTSIGAWTFDYCSGLTSIEIPNSVTSIGQRAFQNCKSLTSVTIGNSLTSIDNWAFYRCSGLTSITCSATTAPSINSTTFASIASNGTLYYPCGSDYSSWTSTDSYYLGYYGWSSECVSDYDLLCTYNVTSTSEATKLSNNTALTTNIESMRVDDVEIDVSSGYTFDTTGTHTVKYKLIDNTKIGDSAFNNCTKLASITIGHSVTSIGNNAFSSCSSLTSIEIPNSVTSIGTYAFSGCRFLTSVTISDGITSIGAGTFYGCNNLKSIEIPNSVTSIDSFAFGSLTSITCYATTAPKINNYTFNGVASNGTLYYPCGSDYSVWMRTENFCLGSYNWTSICF